MCVESWLATVTLKVLFSLDLHVYTVNHTGSMASNTPTRTEQQRQSLNTSRTDPNRRSFNTSRTDPNRRSFNISRSDPNRRSLNTPRTDPNRRSFNTSRTDPNRRSLNTRTDPNRRSFNTARTDPNRRSFNTARTDSNRRSFNTARTDSNRRSLNTRPISHRQSYKAQPPPPLPQQSEIPTSTTEEGGMGVLAPKWVVRLSASLAILGGAFLFSSVSVLTNSFGQSNRGADGPDKTTGIIFMTIGGVSMVVSLGLGYYGCRKRKKKDEDDTSDSGRPLSFAPALSTTADMFPWPSTPSHQQPPAGSPYSTPAAGQPPSFPSPFGGESSRSSNPPGEQPQASQGSLGRGGPSQNASPQEPQKPAELPVVSLPRPASPDPGPSHAS